MPFLLGRLCLNKAASDEIIWHCKPRAEQATSTVADRSVFVTASEALYWARRGEHSRLNHVLLVSSMLTCKLKVMKYYSSGADLAKDMGVSLSVIEKAHEDHFQAAKKTETHPNDGPFPAYPSGKCWDEARYHNFSRK